MWPSLRAGDEAGVEPVEEPLRAGEVVLARLERALVVHRVQRCEGERWVLRGDNSHGEDPPLRPGQVLGRVSHVRRGGEVLGPGRWDKGPRRLGLWRVRWRVAARRALAMLRGLRP